MSHPSLPMGRVVDLLCLQVTVMVPGQSEVQLEVPPWIRDESFSGELLLELLSALVRP